MSEREAKGAEVVADATQPQAPAKVDAWWVEPAGTETLKNTILTEISSLSELVMIK